MDRSGLHRTAASRLARGEDHARVVVTSAEAKRIEMDYRILSAARERDVRMRQEVRDLPERAQRDILTRLVCERLVALFSESSAKTK